MGAPRSALRKWTIQGWLILASRRNRTGNGHPPVRPTRYHGRQLCGSRARRQSPRAAVRPSSPRRATSCRSEASSSPPASCVAMAPFAHASAAQRADRRRGSYHGRNTSTSSGTRCTRSCRKPAVSWNTIAPSVQVGIPPVLAEHLPAQRGGLQQAATGAGHLFQHAAHEPPVPDRLRHVAAHPEPHHRVVLLEEGRVTLHLLHGLREPRVAERERLVAREAASLYCCKGRGHGHHGRERIARTTPSSQAHALALASPRPGPPRCPPAFGAPRAVRPP